MPNNNFSVGRDIKLNVITPSGQLQFPLATEFDRSPKIKDEERPGLDGVDRNVIFHGGWKGTLKFDRGGPSFDDYWAQVEADYYNGLNAGTATIIETITEPNGQVTQYLYSGVVLKPTDMGSFKGQTVVSQTVEFMAQRRLKVA